MQILVDAFHGGEIRYLEDAQELCGSLMGMDIRLDKAYMEVREGRDGKGREGQGWAGQGRGPAGGTKVSPADQVISSGGVWNRDCHGAFGEGGPLVTVHAVKEISQCRLRLIRESTIVGCVYGSGCCTLDMAHKNA